MTAYDNHRPQDCPETVTAANGTTLLHRFRVDAVIYAPNRAEALARLDNGTVYLDSARLLRDEDAKSCSVCACPCGDSETCGCKTDDSLARKLADQMNETDTSNCPEPYGDTTVEHGQHTDRDPMCDACTAEAGQ